MFRPALAAAVGPHHRSSGPAGVLDAGARAGPGAAARRRWTAAESERRRKRGRPRAIERLVADGWGYATINPGSIQADNGAGLTKGIIGLVKQGSATATGRVGFAERHHTR